MKLIDLLNKIANGEEIPQKFIYNDYIFNLGDDNRYRDNEDDYLSDSIRYDFENLNEEIKIIEDEDIERLKESISRIKKVYTSMQFSAPENMYIFIDQLGLILDEVENKKGKE